MRTTRIAGVVMAAVALVGTGTLGAQAGGAPAQVAAQGLGWHRFLPASAVQKPTGIAIDLRGNGRSAQWGYVADSATGRIVKFGTRGKVLGSWPYGPAGARADLAVGGAGTVYVVNEANGKLSKFTPTGKLIKTLGPFGTPRSVTVDAQGNVYLAEYGAGLVSQFSPAMKLLHSWNTSAGLTSQFSVPHMNTGPLGMPTGVAYVAPDRVITVTECLAKMQCSPHSDLPQPPYGRTGLLLIEISGQYAGWVGNYWFGLGFGPDGAPVDFPGKEDEPYITVDAVVTNRKQRAYLAGVFWPRGGTASRGVMTYDAYGMRTGPWPLASQSSVSGVAVDRSGAIYVTQDGRILKHGP